MTAWEWVVAAWKIWNAIVTLAVCGWFIKAIWFDKEGGR